MSVSEHLEISTKYLTYFGLLYDKRTANFWINIQVSIIGIVYDPKIMLQKSYLFMRETQSSLWSRQTSCIFRWLTDEVVR